MTNESMEEPLPLTVQVRKRRGRPPLSPEERARRLNDTPIPPAEWARRRAISESVKQWHVKQGHHLRPQPLTQRTRMKVKNGYVEVSPCEDGYVMTVTEIDHDIPSGSRTSKVVLNLEQVSGIVGSLSHAPSAHA